MFVAILVFLNTSTEQKRMLTKRIRVRITMIARTVQLLKAEKKNLVILGKRHIIMQA